jgi:hypothetical protein
MDWPARWMGYYSRGIKGEIMEEKLSDNGKKVIVTYDIKKYAARYENLIKIINGLKNFYGKATFVELMDVVNEFIPSEIVGAFYLSKDIKE